MEGLLDNGFVVCRLTIPHLIVFTRCHILVTSCGITRICIIVEEIVTVIANVCVNVCATTNNGTSTETGSVNCSSANVIVNGNWNAKGKWTKTLLFFSFFLYLMCV